MLRFPTARNEVAGSGELLLNKGSLQLPGDGVAKCIVCPSCAALESGDRAGRPHPPPPVPHPRGANVDAAPLQLPLCSQCLVPTWLLHPVLQPRAEPLALPARGRWRWMGVRCQGGNGMAGRALLALCGGLPPLNSTEPSLVTSSPSPTLVPQGCPRGQTPSLYPIAGGIGGDGHGVVFHPKTCVTPMQHFPPPRGQG